MTAEILRLDPPDPMLLASLMRESIPPDFGERWQTGDMASVLGMSGCGALVAKVQDAPAGFALWRAVLDEAELLLLGVVPSARRSGLARRLLQQSMTSLASRGIIRLHLEVRATNEAALALYESEGFVLAGRRPRYYLCRDGSRVDALTFSRALS
jgi:[ribosomal protein S18]-alanine N-acetyltransferase